MNISEYISSGILDQYIAGTTTAQEKQEVECMSHIYPEIFQELQSIQSSLEALAQAEGVAPPADLRKNIFDAIDGLANDNPIKSESGNNSTPKTELTFTKSNLGYKSAAAILFLVSAGLGYLLYDSNKNASTFANDLALVKKEIAKNAALLENKEAQITILKDKAYQAITMAGVPTKDTSLKASIYFNRKSEEVYVSLQNLPQPTSGKQYQLWAIADGKPVDLGVIDLNNTNGIMQKMKGIKNPQAFAITLEKEGGVPSPTMTEMVVMGGV